MMYGTTQNKMAEVVAGGYQGKEEEIVINN
jgi:hypothetical protein